MRQASVANLKARLSEYLDAVKSGEEVVVTERGRPVARLIPIKEAERLEGRMEELIRAGVIRAPLRPLPHDFFDLPRPADPEGRVLAALLEERKEGR